MKHQQRPYQPIANYGIIGNLKTVALVSMNGSIDFMSSPNFDSPTVFAAMLDSKKGGFFSIEPMMAEVQTRQLYLPGTAVLITRFFSDDGIAEITDYMPLATGNEQAHGAIVRKVKAIRGRITFQLHCAPRFNYALTNHVTYIRDNEINFTTDDEHSGVQLHLMADISLSVKGHDAYSKFTLNESEIAHVVLKTGETDSQEKSDKNTVSKYVEESYLQTVRTWRNWLSKSNYKGHYSELIFRSAITLKLLTSAKYGSVIAAPTFGLPETLGGNRNWDYRFTWIRDAAFTMYAFLALGFYDEATDFMEWISNLCRDKKLQLIYRMDGSKISEEKELDHLEGYQSSKPVRIGNAAAKQQQLDIYGELIDTIYIYNKTHKPITYEFWTLVEKQIECVVRDWQMPDHGIWEVRGKKREFLHSRLMSWVAMDRAIKIAEHRSFPYPESEWRTLRDDIYKDIYHNFWNEDLQAWVQHTGSKYVDASVLLMPLTHYISPLENRWKSTMNAIEKQLKLDVLIYRYRDNTENIDGLEGEEGTFNMCSFWYIEALAKAGRIEEAVESFEKMTAYANHLGLFSEELGKKGEHLGNFPQAFTHLSLISAALELNKQLARL